MENKVEGADLRSCAHCLSKGSPYTISPELSPFGYEVHMVQCLECGASTGAFRTQKEATEAWNRRDGEKRDA